MHLTLKSLLIQTVRPYAVILWVGHEDINKLPQKIHALTSYGLKIQACRDIRSHTKLIPCLEKYPENTIVTADDDVYYWRTWLKELLDERKPNVAEIICHRMHRIRLNKDNLPVAYNAWEYESRETEPHDTNFATGVLGILYPPHSLHPLVFDTDSALRLCPAQDDVWFYWAARLKNTPIRRVKKTTPIYCWTSSQNVALSIQNTCEGFNDVQIKRMIDAYGFPNTHYFSHVAANVTSGHFS